MQDGATSHTASDLFERCFSSWLNPIVLKNIRFMVPKKRGHIIHQYNFNAGYQNF